MERIIEVCYGTAPHKSSVRIFMDNETLGVWVDLAVGEGRYYPVYETEYSGLDWDGPDSIDLDDNECVSNILDNCIDDIENRNKEFWNDTWGSIYFAAKYYYDAEQILGMAIENLNNPYLRSFEQIAEMFQEGAEKAKT